MKHMKHIKLLIVITALLLSFAPKGAKAQLCCKCDETIEKYMDYLFLDESGYLYPFLYGKDPTVEKTLRHIEGEFTSHKQWLVGIVWEDNVLPAMMMMADELVNAGMKQVEAIGQLFDAKIQLEAQQAIQVEEAKINKLYTPSAGMCQIATSTKSLAASERRAEINKHVINQRSLARHLGRVGTSAYSGKQANVESRLKTFQKNYCNQFDNKSGMDAICDGLNTVTNRNRQNRDIDYVRFMDAPWTINVDFTDDSLTHYEEDILAMAENLYGHQVPHRPTGSAIDPDISDGNALRGVTSLQKEYMNLRSLIAKRSIAENSFYEIMSMKTPGSPGAREYMVQLLGTFGLEVKEGMPTNPTQALDNIKNNEASQILNGDDFMDIASANPLTRATPSYHAQMEILTKKMFQDPNFYMNLYDKPINVTRKEVSLQAIGLMQKFDVFKSYLRQEAVVSMLLELAITDLQKELDNEINE